MKKITLLLCALLFVGFSMNGNAADDYTIKKIDVSFVDTPAYNVNPPAKQVRAKKWLQMEVAFQSKVDFTEELVFNYYVYFAERLFVGKVECVNIVKERELFTIAYMAPNAIASILQGRTLTASDLVNVSVTITKPGVAAPLAVAHWKSARGAWWEAMKQEPGYIVNKSETPFAPLSWDRYESLKPASAR